MAQLLPFRALRYAPATDLSRVTCPPYDVLSDRARQVLFDRSPHAAVRVILPEGDAQSRYTNAATLLQEWQNSGVLQQDATPAFYVTRTDFVEPNATFTQIRYGLVGLLRLHPYTDGHVLPHEHTLDKPKEDRLNLLRATQANVESILCLADDDNGQLLALLEQAAQGHPVAQFTDDSKHTHTLYAVTDTGAIAALVAPLRIFIADGHHRYETSLAYAQETGSLGTDKPEAFILATLVSTADLGLVALPTHRLVRGTDPDHLNTLFAHLEPVFDIVTEDVADMELRLTIAIGNQPVIGMVLPSGTVYQLTLRDVSALDNLLPRDIHPSLRQLEPVILEHLILHPAFGIAPETIATTDRIAYTRDPDDAIRQVREGAFDAAFLLGRPAPTAVRDVALAGQVMPQKSTFYYPKLSSGLVMRKF